MRMVMHRADGALFKHDLDGHHFAVMGQEYGG